MTRKRMVVLSLLVCLAACAVAFFVVDLKDQGPTHNGRTLSQWYALKIAGELGHEPPATIDTAESAIREIGTNAIPYLLNRIQGEDDGSLMPQWQRLAHQVPVVGSWLAGKHARAVTPGEANNIFFILGTNGAPAVPELAALVNNTHDPEVRDRAFDALRAIGDDSLPFLTSVIGDPDHPNRLSALSAVHAINPARFSTKLAVVVPHLVSCSTNSDPHLAWLALSALGRIRLQPEMAIPALTNALQSKRRSIRWSAMQALGLYHEHASNAVPALQLAMHDPDETTRLSASNALQQILYPKAFRDPY